MSPITKIKKALGIEPETLDAAAANREAAAAALAAAESAYGANPDDAAWRSVQDAQSALYRAELRERAAQQRDREQRAAAAADRRAALERELASLLKSTSDASFSAKTDPIATKLAELYRQVLDAVDEAETAAETQEKNVKRAQQIASEIGVPFTSGAMADAGSATRHVRIVAHALMIRTRSMRPHHTGGTAGDWLTPGVAGYGYADTMDRAAE